MTTRPDTTGKLPLTELAEMKRRGDRIVMVTAYDAPGGYSGWRAIAALSRRYGNLYVGGFVRHDDLRGASFAPSPLVRKDSAFTAGFGISWIFAASSQRVVAED